MSGRSATRADASMTPPGVSGAAQTRHARCACPPTRERVSRRRSETVDLFDGASRRVHLAQDLRDPLARVVAEIAEHLLLGAVVGHLVVVAEVDDLARTRLTVYFVGGVHPG